MNRRFTIFLASIVAVSVAGAVSLRLLQAPPTSTGLQLAPVGDQTEVGSFPVNMVLSPNGKFVIVSDCGARQQLSVLDASNSKVVSSIPFNEEKSGEGKQQMYYGLVFGSDGTLFVSRGGQDRVTRYTLSDDGKLTSAGEDLKVPGKDSDGPNFIAGLASSQDGKQLFAIGNESYLHKVNGQLTGGQGTFNTVDLATGSVQSSLDVGGFPFDVATAGKKVYVSSERDGVVTCVDPTTNTVTGRLKTGDHPVNLRLSHDGSKLFVSNASSDTVSVIDTSNDQILKTILVRPPLARGLPGTTPLGLALSADDATLFVACADLSAVAVVDTVSGTLKGYIPVGWYPTSVLLSQDGKRLFVANAKGVKTKNPNSKSVRDWGMYVENILEGTVSTINVEAVMKDLQNESRTVFRANQFVEQQPSHFMNPKPKHVIYVIKENRTCDQVYGDVAKGNGDPSLCMFPKDVTPNQHALADRFVLLDNFYVCSEVSADGWNWSTSGMASEYTERNVRVNYSGRGRDYDSEGDTNGTPTDLYGVPDVATSPGGYIWDAAAKAHVSFRNYGSFVDADDKKDAPGAEVPDKKALQGVTDPDFRQFDMGFADSDAWVKLGTHAPKQLLAYGVHKSPSRFSEWKREFDEFVKNGNLPQLMLLRVPCDHTTGTRAGFFAPQALVADNDYAVGELVDAVSHSPYWKDTVICVLEDDAQAGQDHVDCHRSGALIISPYVERGKVSSHFWNTDSMLKTIEVMVGLKPMNHYDGFALPIDVFGSSASNAEPYKAILPDKSIITAINTKTAYRERDSDRLIKQYSEESGPDIELNDILWGAIMGPKGKR
jgi:YVTN family beta-propeller protein